jgi:hypothetical protein
MAAPNIVGGKVVKVNLLTLSNVNGASSADVTVDLFRDSVAYRIASTISIPEDASLEMLSKSIYLEEGDSLRLTASADLYLEAVCSYEEIS